MFPFFCFAWLWSALFVPQTCARPSALGRNGSSFPNTAKTQVKISWIQHSIWFKYQGRCQMLLKPRLPPLILNVNSTVTLPTRHLLIIFSWFCAIPAGVRLCTSDKHFQRVMTRCLCTSPWIREPCGVHFICAKLLNHKRKPSTNKWWPKWWPICFMMFYVWTLWGPEVLACGSKLGL